MYAWLCCQRTESSSSKRSQIQYWRCVLTHRTDPYRTSHSPIIPEQLSVKLVEFNWKYTAALAKTLIQQLSQQNYSNNIPLNLNAVKMLPINMKKNHQMSCCDMVLFIFTVPVPVIHVQTHTQTLLSVNEKHHSECASCTLMHLTGCEWGYRLTGGGL